jgi:hypothetical protein
MVFRLNKNKKNHMNTKNIKSLIIIGALSGMLSILSYMVAAFASLPNSIVFLLVMLFPMLGIIFIFSMKEFIDQNHSSYANKLSFVFGSLAFTILAIFISAQLAVQIGIDTTSAASTSDNLKTIKRSIRLVDMGMDVAWDMFIGTYLILFFLSTRKVPSLKWWGTAFGFLGLILIILNVITFPYPPAESGLFDLGPFIALTLLLLSVWMLIIGSRLRQTSST